MLFGCSITYWTGNSFGAVLLLKVTDQEWYIGLFLVLRKNSRRNFQNDQSVLIDSLRRHPLSLIAQLKNHFPTCSAIWMLDEDILHQAMWQKQCEIWLHSRNHQKRKSIKAHWSFWKFGRELVVPASIRYQNWVCLISNQHQFVCLFLNRTEFCTELNLVSTPMPN